MIDPLQHMEGSERAKDLEYLKDVLRNNCQIIMGAIKRIVESTVAMSDALNAFESKWEERDVSENRGEPEVPPKGDQEGTERD